MKRVPNVYGLRELCIMENAVCINGRWLPARPLGFGGLMLIRRLKLAWKVFTGELDAVKWPGGQ